jgi:hypothetical protein
LNVSLVDDPCKFRVELDDFGIFHL